jgi:hypothetical protein
MVVVLPILGNRVIEVQVLLVKHEASVFAFTEVVQQVSHRRGSLASPVEIQPAP